MVLSLMTYLPVASDLGHGPPLRHSQVKVSFLLEPRTTTPGDRVGKASGSSLLFSITHPPGYGMWLIGDG